MSKSWQDQFDLDNEPKKTSKKQINKKINKPINNQFQDLDDDESKNVKFPSINSKNVAQNVLKDVKKNQQINLQGLPKNKVEKNVHKNKEDSEDEMEYLEQVAPESPKRAKPVVEIKQSKKAIVEKKQEKNQDEDQYAEEFQELEEQKQEVKLEKNKKQAPSPIPYKAKDQKNKISQKNLKIQRPSIKQNNKTELLKPKNQPSNRQISRNSDRSQSQSRTIQIKSRTDQKKDQNQTNKYTQLVEKTSNDYDKKQLQEFQNDKLIRENDKLRGLIKKLNDELNDLINKNIMQLKNKKEEKVIVIEDTLKVLEEQKNNNETVYQSTCKELQRLKGKEGQLKQEEYQLGIESNISETKVSIAQFSKILTKIRNDINNQGIKLLKIDKQSTIIQDINNIKNTLANSKKEQQKNEQIIKKLDIKNEQLSDKINGMEGKIKSLVDQAGNKGFSIINNGQNKKKVQELKKRIDIARQHKVKTEALLKTKSEMIVHQSEQIRNQVKLNDKITQIAVNNCEEVQLQSKKTVEKAKKGSKLSSDLIATLEDIIKQMENNTNGLSRQSKDQTLNYPKGSKKYQSVKNVEKELINTKPIEEKEQIVLKKPNLFKKKEKEQEQEGAKQRVWKDEKEKQVEKKKTQQYNKFQNRQNEKKDEQKIKPFVIKKNRQSRHQQAQIPSPNQSKKQESIHVPPQIKKDESETPSIAPRMMKFKKNKLEQQQNNKISPEVNDKKIVPPVPEQQKTIQQEQKINFVPKRFNLKLKDKKIEENGYISSAVQKKQEQKIVQKPVQQYKPKGFNIEKQPLFKIQSKKQVNLNLNNPLTQTEQEEKPKFNLKLRDRQKQSNKILPKEQVPLQTTMKEAENKMIANNSDNSIKPQNNVSKENNPYTNPYANNANPIKKEREGPIKKDKQTQNIQKQNFNIYEQAEDITIANDIKVHKEEPKYTPKPLLTEVPDLNKLLGIEKKKQRDSLHDDLILDNKILIKKEKKADTKKDTDFFGDLQI